MQDEASKLDQLWAKRAILQQKKADLEKKIRDLGSLPSSAFDKFRNHSLSSLQQLLSKAQAALKKYGSVASLSELPPLCPTHQNPCPLSPHAH